MAAEISDCLDPSTKDLFCSLTSRYGSVQIPLDDCDTETATNTKTEQGDKKKHKKINSAQHKGCNHPGGMK